VAKELNIDAIQAYIYLSTGHAVECARLNGKNRRTYYPAELFSGKQGKYCIITSYCLNVAYGRKTVSFCLHHRRTDTDSIV
jgi:hypothetical protein